MTDVNKNIFEAYKSMYEPKEEVLDEKVKKEDASNDKSDDGDGMDKVDPKAVKKKFKDRKDQDIDNDGDVDSSDEYLHKRRKAVSKAISKEEVKYPHMMYSKDGKDEVSVKSPEEHDKYAKKGYVHDKPDVKESFTRDDIRAMCHSKDHDCATYVNHPVFGLGKPVYESHAIPDDNGYVEWYDVEFAHGIEREVPAKDMEIIEESHHGSGGNGDMKKKKKKEPIEDDTVINVDNDEEEAPQMDSDEKPMKKKKPPMPPKKDNGEKEDDVEEPEDDGKDVKIISKDKKKKNGNGNGNGKTAEISKIGEEVSQFTSLLKELSAADVASGRKKKEKDGKEPESYEDISKERGTGETDFIDAHGKKDVAVDVNDAIKQTTKTAQDTKQGKHVKGQTAKGDTKPIKSTEAPVKDKEVKDGEGKKSVTKESTLMDMALKALKGQTVPEMKQIIASKEAPKNPFDARTKDAKAFLERMAKRKNGENGQYKDKDPKDLPMIKSGYGKKK